MRSEQSYLRPEHTNDDGSQLLVLPSEAPHVIQAGLELTVGRTETPHHLQILLPLPLHNVPQEHLQLLVLVLPRLEDFETRHHHLRRRRKSVRRERAGLGILWVSYRIQINTCTTVPVP